MECLELMEGQRCAKKLSDKQTAAMIKAVTKPAYQRQRDIVQKVRTHKLNTLYTLLDYCL